MGFTLGLTGSIATGKSTVSKMLQDEKIPVIDADLVARKVVEKGTVGLEKIVSTFGDEVLSKGALNRAKLGEIIFHDSKKREQLNKIVHPLVRKEMLQERDRLFKSGETFVVLDIPLLYESQLTDLVDQVLVVMTTEEVELTRLMARNELSREEALARIATQMPISDKAKLADFVIDNSGTLKETSEQVNELLHQLKRHGIIERNDGSE
ncbi:dephospho-CoA kinase [Listeria aquatica]|uniref:Dephospho-CoA kinase n=1 Tax=Listeria aquatica FSL S10-1188 TaxID=1265818 RepID=W7ARD9_9LIST|nr:dephospho-CoA kinase [Listeria aquatica]EUJ17754.1 dephospho-CoA kinase [Listeria aquatica FSL S10-1188]